MDEKMKFTHTHEDDVSKLVIEGDGRVCQLLQLIVRLIPDDVYELTVDGESLDADQDYETA